MAIARVQPEDLSNHWWVILLRGIVGAIFAVLAFAWPGATLLALVFVWGAYAVVDGASALYLTLLAARQERRWWPYLLEGLAGIGAGIVAFAVPGITALVPLYLIVAWAILTGIVEIVAAVDPRKQIRNGWLLGLARPGRRAAGRRRAGGRLDDRRVRAALRGHAHRHDLPGAQPRQASPGRRRSLSVATRRVAHARRVAPALVRRAGAAPP
jgi:uncharacterized membrane protein HdeD (DUF308 family)